MINTTKVTPLELTEKQKKTKEKHRANKTFSFELFAIDSSYYYYCDVNSNQTEQKLYENAVSTRIDQIEHEHCFAPRYELKIIIFVSIEKKRKSFWVL